MLASEAGYKYSVNMIVTADETGTLDIKGIAQPAQRYQVIEIGKGNFSLIAIPTDLHEREVWLYENPNALSSVMQGLEDSKQGRVRSRAGY